MGASVPDRATHAPHEACKQSSPSGEYPSRFRNLDLFAGIGGFSLGLHRTGGFETAAFCELDAAAQRVLRKHWPEVPLYDDVRTIGRDALAADGVYPNFITAGFPCQDISYAGRGAGLAGERSGLFYEVARLIGELAPEFVILENVSALLSRGLADVLGTLASLGYDAEWHCIPASYVGAPHRRDRIWIVAYPNGCLHAGGLDARADCGSPTGSEGRDAGEGQTPHRQRFRPELVTGGSHVANTECERQPGPGQSLFALCPKTGAYRQAVDAVASGIGQVWATEPDVGRVANGVPGRVDRLKQLGNAVVPQIPELIGNAILASLAEQKEAA